MFSWIAQAVQIFSIIIIIIIFFQLTSHVQCVFIVWFRAIKYHAEYIIVFDCSASFAENVVANVAVVTVTAGDIDAAATNFSSVQYTIDSGDGSSNFIIGNASGRVDTSSTVSIDREAKSTYSLLIKAQDGDSPARSAFIVVDITITDENDNDPIFNPSSFVVSLSENQATNTPVTKAHASDADVNNNADLTFAITIASNVNNHFSISKLDSETAQISTAQPLDREAIAQ